MENPTPHKNTVHRILARSYSVYFIAVLLGIIFNLLFGVQVFRSAIVAPIGVVLLVLGTVLIIWAQYSSAHLNTKDPITKYTFTDGPYRVTRTPTNFGLFFMVLGFGMILNTFFIMVFTLIAFLIAKFVFLDAEEEVLAQKYGAPYLEYKKMVKF